MKNLIFLKQKHSLQILAVVGLSFLLHACGNKDSVNNPPPAITYYGVMSDRTCWQSNGQMAQNPASCNGAPYIDQMGNCISAQGQRLPTIQSCTPSGWYMEGGVCKNGMNGAYGQQGYFGQPQQYYGQPQYGQQQFGNQAPPAGQCQGQGWNQQFGFNTQTNTFNTQQFNQPYRQPYYGQQQPYFGQQTYQQPTSYWSGSATGTWSSGYVPYTGWSTY